MAPLRLFTLLGLCLFLQRVGSLWGVPPGMRISLPRHDLLGQETKEKGQEPVPQWAFIGFNLHRNTGKVHQSLSGSKDQRIDNKEL